MYYIHNSKMKDANVVSFCFPNALCGLTRVEKLKSKDSTNMGTKGDIKEVKTFVKSNTILKISKILS